MQYREFVRIERIKHMLDIIAYGSLGIDIAIAVATMISLNFYSAELSRIEYLLNVGVTIEVFFTFVLLIALAFLYRYEKIVDNLASVSRLLTGTKRQRKRR
ncbi:MAG: hypothetical protein M1286_00235 [Candidatus Marsarchaeota archaeon]|nr:hypothetical protein [Candidatus Marsarchaeota archaeon]